MMAKACKYIKAVKNGLFCVHCSEKIPPECRELCRPEVGFFPGCQNPSCPCRMGDSERRVKDYAEYRKGLADGTISYETIRPWPSKRWREKLLDPKLDHLLPDPPDPVPSCSDLP